jgi:hypothetical protein
MFDQEYCPQCDGETHFVWKWVEAVPNLRIREVNDKFRRKALAPDRSSSLPGCSPLLARLPGLRLQPTRQLGRKRIKFAGPIRNAERRLNSPRSQIFTKGVARQLRPPRDLPDGQMLPQCPTPNDTQKCHVDHSNIPCGQQPRGRCHMGHFSMKIMPLPGSLLGANQQVSALTKPAAEKQLPLKPATK